MAKQTAQSAQIDAYYNTLDELAQQYATHEGAVSVAFQTLLADTARRRHWTLIPQLTAAGIRPDATLKDPMGLVRGGCWNSKPDDLRSAYRNYEKPAYTDICFAKDVHGQVGFRCVRRLAGK